MVRGLVLDFGGVITRTIHETHEQTEAALGLPPGTLNWLGPFAPHTDPLWVAMQNEELSERDYYAQRTREVSQLVGTDWTKMSQFIQAARGAEPLAIIRPEALQAIDLAKSQGHKLAILSNEMDLFYGKDFRSKLPFLASFDVIVDASYSNILKPDPRAYLACCEKLDLSPSACVFVDDQLKNVKGAGSLGMATVHFDVIQPGESFDRALALLNQTTGSQS